MNVCAAALRLRRAPTPWGAVPCSRTTADFHYDRRLSPAARQLATTITTITVSPPCRQVTPGPDRMITGTTATLSQSLSQPVRERT
eukprot:6453224-Alexandrium_andersonii.AAC.1